jgi:Zn-finger nucleic acid-binding protein
MTKVDEPMPQVAMQKVLEKRDIPETPDYDRSLVDPNQEREKHPKPQNNVELAAAIMADSGHYAYPLHAVQHVASFRDGKEIAACERCMAVFGGDLVELIDSAKSLWQNTTDERREKYRNKVESNDRAMSVLDRIE